MAEDDWTNPKKPPCDPDYADCFPLPPPVPDPEEKPN